MPKKTVIGFHRFLSERADYGAAGEKPIFLMAVLKYMLTRDVFGVSLLDLLHPQHRLKTKRFFLSLAGVGGRLKTPERSWDMVAGKDHLEIKDAIDDMVQVLQMLAKHLLDSQRLMQRVFLQDS